MMTVKVFRVGLLSDINVVATDINPYFRNMSVNLDLIESRISKLEELVGKSEGLNDANVSADPRD